ncbi:MAG TPA: endonuclease domain-containing protein [Rhizomicrobium sp.]|jgi:adenine-specific DNA-methyltransferase
MPKMPDPVRRRDIARQFRQSPTDAERKLWSLLRSRRLANWRFRRQQPIGPYFADFFCPSAKLIIELDGSQHADEAHLESDALRTNWLQSRGYAVLRFWNNEVMKSPESVLETIFQNLERQTSRAEASPLPENRSR